MAVDVAVDLDAAGEVLRGAADVWSNGHSSRPGRATTPTLLAAAHRADAAPHRGHQHAARDRRRIRPQRDARLRLPRPRGSEPSRPAMPLRTSALRSLGAFANVFAIESMVDDIAHARGEDPVAWRLRHIADPRARAVIEAVAARAPWAGWQAREGFGRGFAFARYKATAPIAPWRWKWSSRTRCA
jgi:hypothetical protein